MYHVPLHQLVQNFVRCRVRNLRAHNAVDHVSVTRLVTVGENEEHVCMAQAKLLEFKHMHLRVGVLNLTTVK